MKLLLQAPVQVVSPLTPNRMAVPSMLVTGLAKVALEEISKLPWLRLPELAPLTEYMMALVPKGLRELRPLTMLPVMEMILVASLGMPTVHPGPLALALLILTCMPAPLGKFEMVLFAMVALVRLKQVPADPTPTMLTPCPSEVVTDVVLVIVLFEMVALEIVPAPHWMSMPLK